MGLLRLDPELVGKAKPDVPSKQQFLTLNCLKTGPTSSDHSLVPNIFQLRWGTFHCCSNRISPAPNYQLTMVNQATGSNRTWVRSERCESDSRAAGGARMEQAPGRRMYV